MLEEPGHQEIAGVSWSLWTASNNILADYVISSDYKVIEKQVGKD